MRLKEVKMNLLILTVVDRVGTTNNVTDESSVVCTN